MASTSAAATDTPCSRSPSDEAPQDPAPAQEAQLHGLLQLAAALFQPPGEALRDDLATGRLGALAAQLARGAEVPAIPLCNPPEWGALQSGRMRLFSSTPSGLPAPPYIGYALDGELLGPSAQTLRAFLDREGLTFTPGWHELPDHVAAVAEAQLGWLRISAETAMTRIDAIDPVVIDVRTQSEWDEQGHIPGAILIPVVEMSMHLDMLPADPNTPIIVYCARGTRGNYGMLYLKMLGYTNVKNLSGGFGAWVDEGLPVEN